MTRSEAYAEGFQEGRRWAESDIAGGLGAVAWGVILAQDASAAWLKNSRSEWREYWHAEALGRARGYRDTVARYEAGTLTRQMFEHAPRSGAR